MLKINYWKIGKKKDNDIDADVAQLERNKNKYYASAFRNIQMIYCGECLIKVA